MITKPGGYPLDSWGADGYGIACDSETCVRDAIDRLQKAGAKIIKLALGSSGLPAPLARKATKYAHERGLKVVVHAMQSNAAGSPVTLAAGIGADVLAHVPIEPLSDVAIGFWSKPGRAVITTLAAFGGSDIAVENLRRLHAAGATILYGTDLGNLRDEGPSAAEIALMKKAGLDDAAIVASMTTSPIRFWGFDFDFAAGKEATFFVLTADPRQDVNALLEPSVFFNRGH
jgi:imidazolonepropionase-like amidohydrolase